MNTVQIQEAPSGAVVKNLPSMQEMRVQSLGWADSLEKKMVIHTSILACEIPWAEEPGRVLSMGLQRVGQDLVTKQQEAPILCQPLFIILKTTMKAKGSCLRTAKSWRGTTSHPQSLCSASVCCRPAHTTCFSLP